MLLSQQPQDILLDSPILCSAMIIKNCKLSLNEIS